MAATVTMARWTRRREAMGAQRAGPQGRRRPEPPRGSGAEAQPPRERPHAQAGRGSCSPLGTEMYHGEDGAAVVACHGGQRPQAEGAAQPPRGEVWWPG